MCSPISHFHLQFKKNNLHLRTHFFNSLSIIPFIYLLDNFINIFVSIFLLFLFISITILHFFFCWNWCLIHFKLLYFSIYIFILFTIVIFFFVIFFSVHYFYLLLLLNSLPPHALFWIVLDLLRLVVCIFFWFSIIYHTSHLSQFLACWCISSVKIS